MKPTLGDDQPQRIAFREDRGVACLQSYGTADLGNIAYESPAMEGMIADEHVVIEIVTPGTGDPVTAGGRSVGRLGTVIDHFELGPIALALLKRTIPVDINQDGMEDWNAEVLQTDAAINPGNSGGALINISGQLIGINSMKIAQSAVEGIGLAIPINYAQPIIEDLEQYGEVKRPAMGVTLEDVNKISAYHQQETLKLPKEINYGVMIRQTVPNSPAAQAGLQELDVITELDGEKIENVIELRKHLYNKKDVNDQMKVTLYRNGEKKEVTMKLTDESRL